MDNFIQGSFAISNFNNLLDELILGKKHAG